MAIARVCASWSPKALTSTPMGIGESISSTPLHEAAKLISAYPQVVALLEAGADPLARNAQGATPHDYLHVTPEQVLNEQAKADLAAIDVWLEEHDIPVEHDAGG